MDAHVSAEWVDEFGTRHIEIDLGGGTTYHIHIEPLRRSDTGAHHFRSFAVPAESATAPSFIVHIPLEGKPTFTGPAKDQEQRVLDDLERRDPKMHDAFIDMLAAANLINIIDEDESDEL